MKDKKENKDYVINLRVSRATYDKLKKKAAENRDTLSGFVRKAIGDGSEVVRDLSRDVFGDRRKRKLEDIVSYHEADLARDTECAACGKALKKGRKASVGHTASGTAHHFCADCA